MAHRDHGLRWEEHLVELRRIASGSLEPLAPLHWIPGEVLQLERNQESSGQDGDEAAYLARLFASLVLLRAAAMPVNRDRADSITGELITCVDSIVAAFPDKAGDLLEFLEALEQALTETASPLLIGERAFLHLARFLLLASQEPLPQAALQSEADAVEHAVSAARQAEHSFAKKPRNRYGWVLKVAGGTQHRGLWMAHLDRVAESLRCRGGTRSAPGWIGWPPGRHDLCPSVL